MQGLLIRLREFSHALHERARREAPEGFGMQHLLVMKILATEGPQKQTDLAGLLGISKGAASQTLRGLEEGGFIERRRDEGDARVHWIHATDRARRFKAELEDRMSALFQDVFQDWGDDDVRRMGQMLDGLIERARAG